MTTFLVVYTRKSKVGRQTDVVTTETATDAYTLTRAKYADLVAIVSIKVKR